MVRTGPHEETSLRAQTDTVMRIPQRVEKVLGRRAVGTKAVLDEFHRAIERDEEGVIAKQVVSPYLPTTAVLSGLADYWRVLRQRAESQCG